MQRRRILMVAIAASLAVAAAATVRAATSVKPYVVPIGSAYEVVPLWSVNDTVPETSNPAKKFRMVGIPDGLGAHPNSDGTSTLYMNHELNSSTLSEPVIGDPQNRGTFVSKVVLDGHGDPISGERAYDTVFNENTLVGPAPQTDNTTRPFARFCSGFLAGPQNGFDRHIYLTNEEESNPALTFDGKGGLSVAIFDNEIHTLPKFGRFSKENTVVQPGQGEQTVAFTLEDGPAAPDNQLFMYVGTKDRSAHATALARNGLDNGKLYVFRSLDQTKTSEKTFTSGSVQGEWVEVPNAENLTAAELEAAVDAIGAMTFIRIEDGAFSTADENVFFFDTTGENKAEGNELGRVYSLLLNWQDVLKPATLTVVVNADQVVAQGGDTVLSPDNLDTNDKYLIVQEDGTTPSRAVMAAKGRDGSIWRFDLVPGHEGADGSSATRVAELDPPGRDGVAVGPGVWETSGIIDSSTMFGAGSWLADVQAHPPTTAPAPGTVEDGQLFLLRPA
jgi:secreted PhoX family phosphatase